MKIYIGLLFLSALTCINAYKILVVFPMPGKSHGILGNGIVRHLLNAGHEITYITPFPTKTTNPKLHEVDVSKNLELLPEEMLDIKKMMVTNVDQTDPVSIMMIMREISKATLAHENVQKLLADTTQKFDAVIGEWMFNEVYTTLAAVYEAPFIYSSSIDPHSMILSQVDGYLNPAYSGFMDAGLPPFSFWQRIRELWNQVKVTVIRETIYAYLQNSDYQTYVVPHIEKRGLVPPSFETLKYNASLLLGNSHVSLGEATTIPQIYKPIAGYHIDETPKPLTEDLKKLMDGAKHGVIYFSLGSNLKSKSLPDAIKKDLLKLFGTLKQTVLWKFEEVLPDLPSNVHILKWAPQQSILSHPNCIIFITHGGLLSTTEAVHTATPIIGIPVFADQFQNVERAVKRGFALEVKLAYEMVPKLGEALQEMISNPKYLKKVQELSAIYHDRPVKPGVEVTHWVEHVIKTKGAKHLRSPGLNIPLYQKLYLDFILLLIVVAYAVTKIVKYVRKTRADKHKKNK